MCFPNSWTDAADFLHVCMPRSRIVSLHSTILIEMRYVRACMHAWKYFFHALAISSLTSCLGGLYTHSVVVHVYIQTIYMYTCMYCAVWFIILGPIRCQSVHSLKNLWNYMIVWDIVFYLTAYKRPRVFKRDLAGLLNKQWYVRIHYTIITDEMQSLSFWSFMLPLCSLGAPVSKRSAGSDVPELQDIKDGVAVFASVIDSVVSGNA